LITLVTYSYLLLPLCFLLSRNKIKDRAPFFIAIYGLIFWALLFFYWQFPKDIRKNYYTYYQTFYTFLEYAVFAYILWYNTRQKKFRNVILIISVLFTLFQFFYVTTTSIALLDSVPIGIETIFIFIYIFYFFYEYSKNTEDSYIYNHYCFWLSVGIMIYLGGSFFFYILINDLDPDEIAKFGNLTYIAEIIKNLLFAVSLFIYARFPVNRISSKSQKIPNLDMI